MTLIEFANEHFGACWALSLILGLGALEVVERAVTRRKP